MRRPHKRKTAKRIAPKPAPPPPVHWTMRDGGADWNDAAADIAVPAQAPVAVYRCVDGSKIVEIRQRSENGSSGVIQIAFSNVPQFVKSVMEARGDTQVTISEK